jgi:HemY protein
LGRLAALNPDHIESRIALAASSLQARLWGEARRHLAPALSADGESAPPRVCRLMAEIEESEHGDMAAAHAWLARAASGEQPGPAWACASCGAESAEWHALCEHCRSFATLAWREADAPSKRAVAVRAETTPVSQAQG